MDYINNKDRNFNPTFQRKPQKRGLKFPLLSPPGMLNNSVSKKTSKKRIEIIHAGETPA